MSNSNTAIAGVLSCLALGCSLFGCDQDQAAGPPTIRYGRDECAECGMILDDERHAAALLVEERGEVSPLFFDDIGDLLDYEKDHPELRVTERWVHDVQTRAWIRAADAYFVVSATIHTPMGSGFVAVAESARAGELGNPIDLDALRAVRNASKNEASPGKR